MNLLVIFLIQMHPFIIQGQFVDARTKNFKCYFLNFDKNKNILVSCFWSIPNCKCAISCR